MWPQSGPGRLLRVVFRIIYITFYNSHKDLVMLRASALTYTVILSIVPLLALGTAVLKGLGAGDQMRRAAYTFIANFEAGLVGEPYLSVEEPAEKGETPGSGEISGNTAQTAAAVRQRGDGAADSGYGQRSMLLHLRHAVDQVFDYVDQTNFATIGIIGVLGLLVIVVLLLDSIEEAINAIWKPVRSRPFGRRFMDYVALLILFPLAVNVGFAAIAAIQNEAFMVMAIKWFPFPSFITLIFKVLPVLIVITTFTLLYCFLPNTRVEYAAALTGGIAGGIGWLLIQVIYIKLQLGVARYNAIYGSFATLPLVLIWIYMGWLVFMLGAEIAFATQMWKRYRIGKFTVTPARQLTVALDAAAAVFEAFRHGKPLGISELSAVSGCMEEDLQQILESLQESAIIRQVKDDSGEDCLFVPAAPPDTISPDRVLKAVCGSPAPESWGGEVAERCLAHAGEAIGREKWPEAGSV